MNKREAPAWYRSGSALQSAVEHLAATFPSFNWVGIYVLRGDTLELGPYIGAPTATHAYQSRCRRVRHRRGAERRHERARRSCARQLPGLQSRDGLGAGCPACVPQMGRILGQIDIDSHTPAAFGPAEEAAVRQVADELGTLWE